MSKRKTKEAQKVQQYKIGDTLQIKGMDYRVVEVLPDSYHVKNISSPFNSFIYAQGQSIPEVAEPDNAATNSKVEDVISAAFEAAKRGETIGVVIPASMRDNPFIINEIEKLKNEPDLLYRPDDRISLNAPSVSEIFKEEQKSSTEDDLGGY